jgi:cell division septation protein DedD
VALVGAAAWFGLRQGPAPAPDPVVASAPIQTAGAPVTPPTAARDGQTTSTPLTESASYSVAVASFRSGGRADEVAKSLKVLELPAYVQTNAEGWHAVFVGPFASRDEARGAQTEVERVHLTDSRIVTTAPSSEGSPGVRAVATAGQKGQP